MICFFSDILVLADSPGPGVFRNRGLFLVNKAREQTFLRATNKHINYLY